MSKTVSELAQELGVSKQYLNRILTKHKLGKIKGNKKVVSDSDVKSILSMLERNIGNQKSEIITTEKGLTFKLYYDDVKIWDGEKWTKQ